MVRHWTLDPGIGVQIPALQIFKRGLFMNKSKEYTEYSHKIIKISLSKDDLNRIFKWYDKGFTNIEEDRPLFDKLKRHYQEVCMADTIHCYNENESCDKCGNKPVEYFHNGDLTDNKPTKLCKKCFEELNKDIHKGS